MSIYSSAVKKPITTLLIFVGVIIFGLYSLVKLPVDFYPEMEFPAITVFTTYSGANAADIETNITKPIEDALSSISDIKEITSTSRDNMSVVMVEFEFGKNLDEAANDIRNSLSFIKRFLPEDAEDPTIYKFNTAMMPILFYSVTADESFDGLEKIMDEKVINPLNRIDGIGNVGLAGLPGREITVEVDPYKLDAYNLSVEQIGNMLRMENVNTPAGNIEMGEIDYPIRVEGEFERSEDIRNIVVGNVNGQSIYLKDVAAVRDSAKDINASETVNGERAARMFVMKQSGANTVNIATQVKKQIEEAKQNLPPDVKIETIFDSSEFISNSISNLSETFMYALLFVVLVVLFFLGRWRATFIVVLTIPISLIVAFIYLANTGNSINIISLSSLSIAIGMVVDDAIVVLENITKHIERGATPREAAIYATNEVWLAVIVTTLTVVAVFFPLTMLGGLTGTFFRQLGWIVSITVVTSTIAAISLTPMLSSKLLRLRSAEEKKKKRTLHQRFIEPFLDWMDNFYEKTLKWAIHHKLVVVILSFVILISSVALVFQVGGEFLPETDNSSISIEAHMQVGTRTDEAVKLGEKIDNYLSETFPEIQLISRSNGSDASAGLQALFQTTGSNIINYSLRLVKPEERNRSVFEIAEDIREHLGTLPGLVEYSVSTSNNMAMGGNNDVEVGVYGYDMDKTTAFAKMLQDKIEQIPGAREVQISRDDFKPELQVHLDRDKMAQHGLTTATVSSALRNRIEGLTATRFREFGDEYDVIVKFKEQYRNSLSDIKNISITTPTGKSIRLEEIADIREELTPPNIEHKRKERIVTVSAIPYKTSLGELATSIKEVLKTMDTPQGVMVEVGGAYEDQEESFSDLLLLMLLSLALVYIVMASQFESFKLPLIIMISIPFSFSGVFLILFLTHTNLSVIALLGAVLLIGIVVKNAIVLVDFIDLMRDRGYELYEAIVISGKSRLRPVLMTALTTILGMTPMALSRGEGSEIWSPMGISVIGGLVFSTIITMIMVPVMYALFSKRGERDRIKKVRERFKFMETPIKSSN
ncbi:efflux RND transporter permease subunit [Saccharicrinis sp. FJH62]|uniref:efflux RND transporter permease subunit n=1 Tax=Saccharicrinis sp. FJH62 TaxID=3344657 RepID=UPI0035D468EB